jgi:tetratricopeptide (TPR) repeat protein
VAYYRVGQYAEALETLQSSLLHTNGRRDAFDLFFLAMCHARLGHAAEAKDCYDRAVKWIQEHSNEVPPEWAADLESFRAEAVLAKAGPGSKEK